MEEQPLRASDDKAEALFPLQKLAYVYHEQILPCTDSEVYVLIPVRACRGI